MHICWIRKQYIPFATYTLELAMTATTAVLPSFQYFDRAFAEKLSSTLRRWERQKSGIYQSSGVNKINTWWNCGLRIVEDPEQTRHRWISTAASSRDNVETHESHHVHQILHKENFRAFDLSKYGIDPLDTVVYPYLSNMNTGTRHHSRKGQQLVNPLGNMWSSCSYLKQLAVQAAKEPEEARCTRSLHSLATISIPKMPWFCDTNNQCGKKRAFVVKLINSRMSLSGWSMHVGWWFIWFYDAVNKSKGPSLPHSTQQNLSLSLESKNERVSRDDANWHRASVPEAFP